VTGAAVVLLSSRMGSSNLLDRRETGTDLSGPDAMHRHKLVRFSMNRMGTSGDLRDAAKHRLESSSDRGA
jgi:hypothetical protein